MSEKQQTQHNQVTGGSVGGIFNGGNNGTIVVNPGAPENPVQPYSARVVMNLPTQGALATTAAVITIVTFSTGWRSLTPLIQVVNGLREGRDLLPPAPGDSQTYWLLALFVCIVALVAVFAGLRHVRNQTFQPPRLSTLPALAGVTDKRSRKRLALVRFSGNCIICNGQLRFYDKPVEWHDEVINGRRKRIIDRREPAAECKKNPKHWYPMDITDLIT
ncbi:hypothetical protein [Ruania rhizosphaerae]|uniref:hypothetical protein n=1 Tax=Ruania rhizosphaerae TaxID=1840413 RepID=UPI00135CECC3|nr:hypothetical protein [Ruania rhizosphaerae]